MDPPDDLMRLAKEHAENDPAISENPIFQAKAQ
jgi:hypothetical protein